MAYYISADGGGTKLYAVVFNEDLQFIGSGISGSTNTNFAPMETVRGHMRACIEQALGGARPEIEGMYYAIVGPGNALVEETGRITRLCAHEPVGEGTMALMAGTGASQGIAALSGTGSNVFMLSPDGRRSSVGGWGSVLGDEGSGYSIGCAALRAAIYAQDGRGPYTLLLPMVMEEWGLGELWDMVALLYHDPQARRKVASAALIASRAAHRGDEAALQIYRDAAREMARGTRAIAAQCSGPFQGPIVAGGSAWKGHPIMFETFQQLLRDELPGADFQLAVFEPVMGGVVKFAIDQGRKPEEFMPLLRERFRQFLYTQ